MKDRLKQQCPQCGTRSSKHYRVNKQNSACNICGYVHKVDVDVTFINAEEFKIT